MLSIEAPRARVLIVDAEPSSRIKLGDLLRGASYDVVEAECFDGALKALAHRPSLIVVVPDHLDTSALAVTKLLRANGLTTALFFVGAPSARSEMIETLAHGANDVIFKPLGDHEVLARVRRTLRANVFSERPLGYACDRLTVDLARRHAIVDGESVSFTRKEFDLLQVFLESPGIALTTDYLIRRVWGSGTDPQYRRYYISRIRKKIEFRPGQLQRLHTVFGVGFKLVNGADRKSSRD